MIVEWSNRAETRLEEIFNYHNEKAGLKTAQKIIRKIYSRAAILVANPQAGPREELLKNRPVEFRYLVEGNYKILYWLELGKATISTVFDCRQNPEKIREEVTE